MFGYDRSNFVGYDKRVGIFAFELGVWVTGNRVIELGITCVEDTSPPFSCCCCCLY